MSRKSVGGVKKKRKASAPPSCLVSEENREEGRSTQTVKIFEILSLNRTHVTVGLFLYNRTRSEDVTAILNLMDNLLRL